MTPTEQAIRKSPDLRFGNWIEQRSPGIGGLGLVATGVFFGGVVIALVALLFGGLLAAGVVLAVAAVVVTATGTTLGRRTARST